jgi:formyl-CoA transferase
LWTRFCQAVGAPDLEHDPRFATNSDRLRHRDALNARITELFRTRRIDDLIEALAAAGVPCGRVRTIEQVLADPQLAARNMLVDVPAGNATVKVPGNPVKLSRVPDLPVAAPPALGEHTDAVRRSTREPS